MRMGKQLRTAKLFRTRHLLRAAMLNPQKNLLQLQHLQIPPLQFHLQQRCLSLLQTIRLQRLLHLLHLLKLRQRQSAALRQRRAPQSLQLQLLQLLSKKKQRPQRLVQSPKQRRHQLPVSEVQHE
ncbi:uncharacterized protein si:dkey-284p5.3 isoform X2 [Larimichthys crocea]|uniref:uncharacterized protein si:dkey-284p5.3 isoform X2 n=1 Tax=Larimichthys crocea TaxID=215358 RepID=UPI000F5F4E92|nr:uncharacterized protein LOC104918645 isoform X2 [Larimichthys crocea]